MQITAHIDRIFSRPTAAGTVATGSAIVGWYLIIRGLCIRVENSRLQLAWPLGSKNSWWPAVEAVSDEAEREISIALFNAYWLACRERGLQPATTEGGSL